MIDGALCFFSLSLKSKRRKTTTQHEEFVRDDVRGGFLQFLDLTKELGGGRKIGLDNYNYNYLYFFSSSSSFSSNADFKSLKLTVADPLSFAFCCVSEGDHPVMYRI